MKIAGQVLLAVGITFMLGGIASFYMENVTLTVFGFTFDSIEKRIGWMAGSGVIAVVGFLLFYHSGETNKQ